MSGPIQTIPRGLLGWLQLKAGGSNPRDLADTVAGTIDLTQLYLYGVVQDEQSLFGAAPTTNAIATGGQGIQAFNIAAANVVVPNGQTWWIHQWTCGGNIATAADSISFSLAISNQQGTRPIAVSRAYFDTINARARRPEIGTDRPGFLMLPGDKFLVWIHDVLSAGGITLSMGLRATVMPL